jgi:hypothetical protein
MGTRESLLAVQRLAQAVTSRAFRARALLVFQGAAEAQGFSAAELAERLAPDLGLTPEGWLPGAPRRRLVVKGLQVQVVDEAGLPVRPPAEGTDALGPLIREAELLLREGAARLEVRMLQGVGMTVEHFTETYLMHPLLRPLAAGLVWSAQDDEGQAVTFTVGARGPEDVQGRPLPLPVEHRVVVASPSALTDEALRAWQLRLPAGPLQQLRRVPRAPRHPGELAVRLQAFQGREVSTAVLLRLLARGWVAGDAEGGQVRSLVRRVGSGGRVDVVLEPGFEPAEPDRAPRQRLVWFRLALDAGTAASVLGEVERELAQVLRGG